MKISGFFNCYSVIPPSHIDHPALTISPAILFSGEDCGGLVLILYFYR